MQYFSHYLVPTSASLSQSVKLHRPTPFITAHAVCKDVLLSRSGDELDVSERMLMCECKDLQCNMTAK
jgi:hypothetical protein